AGCFLFEFRGKRTSLSSHRTPLNGEHCRLSGCPVSLDHYNVEIDGGVKRMCFVLSKTTKLEARPASYKWQAVPVVKLALMALEIGFKRYYDTGNPWLFPSRKDGVFGGKQAVTKKALGHN